VQALSTAAPASDVSPTKSRPAVFDMPGVYKRRSSSLSPSGGVTRRSGWSPVRIPASPLRYNHGRAPRGSVCPLIGMSGKQFALLTAGHTFRSARPMTRS
jgi:hypothetical protein